MSWIWTIPKQPAPGCLLCSPLISMERTRVVVPTYRDWEGARVTIDSILACSPRPVEIVLVNDNAELGQPEWVRRYPILFVDYAGNCGPSFARNAGARRDSGRPIDWLYFTDTDCMRKSDFFAELVEASMIMPRTTVAVAGPVVGQFQPGIECPINRYMTEEAVLNPPRDEHGPQAIITANAAVAAMAFRAVGGFDTTYPFAAGEDLDLGIRMRRLGPIGWAPRALVAHRFAESEDDLRRRFNRYGAGTAHLELIQGLPSLRVQTIVAHDSSLQYLADVQVRAMREGYDAHKASCAPRE